MLASCAEQDLAVLGGQRIANLIPCCEPLLHEQLTQARDGRKLLLLHLPLERDRFAHGSLGHDTALDEHPPELQIHDAGVMLHEAPFYIHGPRVDEILE